MGRSGLVDYVDWVMDERASSWMVGGSCNNRLGVGIVPDFSGTELWSTFSQALGVFLPLASPRDLLVILILSYT